MDQFIKNRGRSTPEGDVFASGDCEPDGNEVAEGSPSTSSTSAPNLTPASSYTSLAPGTALTSAALPVDLSTTASGVTPTSSKVCVDGVASTAGVGIADGETTEPGKKTYDLPVINLNGEQVIILPTENEECEERNTLNPYFVPPPSRYVEIPGESTDEFTEDPNEDDVLVKALVGEEKREKKRRRVRSPADPRKKYQRKVYNISEDEQ